MPSAEEAVAAAVPDEVFIRYVDRDLSGPSDELEIDTPRLALKRTVYYITTASIGLGTRELCGELADYGLGEE